MYFLFQHPFRYSWKEPPLKSSMDFYQQIDLRLITKEGAVGGGRGEGEGEEGSNILL